MIRKAIILAAFFAATPALAQDHSGHGDHAGHSMPASEPAEEPVAHDHSTMDHSTMDHATMNHGSMDHSEMDHGPMDHGTMDHSQMDHGEQPDDHAAMDHAAMDHGTADHSGHLAPVDPDESPPPRAMEGPSHAADAIWGEAAMAPSRETLARGHGEFRGGTIMVERLETHIRDGADGYLWDAQGWYGGDIDKLWLKTEGEGEFGGPLEDAEVQALWSHAIGPFFDLQAGVRYDFEPNSRAHAVLGVQGLAPYMFEVDAALFLSDQGDLTARIEAEYDQLVTQRLILQPRVEFELSAQDIPDREIGAGVTLFEAGLRLRYEIAREFAPYIGVEYASLLGETADLAEMAGDHTGGWQFVAGIRTWF